MGLFSSCAGSVAAVPLQHSRGTRLTGSILLTSCCFIAPLVLKTSPSSKGGLMGRGLLCGVMALVQSAGGKENVDFLVCRFFS